MKLMKRISVVLLSLCLLVPSFSMVCEAAGRISFADPSTAVGEYVELKCAVRTEGEVLGNVEIGLTYDESFLRFESGDGFVAGDGGTLTYSGSGNSSELIFYAKFQALQEGTTKVEISSASVSDSSDAEISVEQGSSTITIAEGDPSLIEDDTESGAEGGAPAADAQIEVAGVVYTLTDEFADNDIPNGYVRTQRTLDGVERQMVENESGNVCLAYLVSAEGTGDFFIYNEEDATFSPYAEISISDTTSIVVLSDTSKVSLPATYKEAKLSLNEKEFPVWQDTEKEGLYVLYAMNSLGETGYYQYDSKEGTYQRIEPAAADQGDDAKETKSLGKIQDFVEANLATMILVVGLGGIIGVLLLIILAVKLHNRNAELDELYDEYGIDLEEEQENAEEVKEEFEEEDFKEAVIEEPAIEEDFEEVELNENDMEEAFEELELVSEVEEEFVGYTDRMDFTIDDLDELLGENTEKKYGHIEDDDTFKVDFIDLD